MDHNVFCEITPEILALSELSRKASEIDSELYTKYEVKRDFVISMVRVYWLVSPPSLIYVRHRLLTANLFLLTGNCFIAAIMSKIWSQDLYRIIVLALKRLHIFSCLIYCRLQSSCRNFRSCWHPIAPCLPALYVISS